MRRGRVGAGALAQVREPEVSKDPLDDARVVPGGDQRTGTVSSGPSR